MEKKGVVTVWKLEYNVNDYHKKLHQIFRRKIFRKGVFMRYIQEFREGDNISDIYLCKSKNIAKTKAGKTYYSLILQDKTGVIDTKIWELNN